ncbi:type IA DNA topoisomerase [Clostridium sardiniense]|uniref:DNA topoisomerase n=1 Tax=Clostridium sardiniense TaxID=29369 RepID=A0ABS7L0H9_CLOSR|nr:DNA topoisomerase [Clostridium sardiniense]MBY0756570.1 type IA DNA topoisomerase [Clostridium sardiniense]MDQ0460319.1 DNA topoisomerase-3 [Clostridium sardiniense]
MGKALFVAEKPSVAMDFVKLLKVYGKRNNGYIESDKAVFTWCVGHMVTMSYPEAYDEKLKYWNLKDLPFLPTDYKYEVINSAKGQFNVVSKLLNRSDIDKIYVCTDSGREGEYIYRLVDDLSGNPEKEKLRIWIDSQTEEEIKRGIKEAKPLKEYDSLAHSAYLRAKEDYIIGINFSRLLTLIYGRQVSNILKRDKNSVVAVGRVMSCVLGMVVDREREIRNFKKTSFYKIAGSFSREEKNEDIQSEWKALEKSKYKDSPKLYNEGGFKKKEDCENLIKELEVLEEGIISNIKKTKENKNAPLLFNLAELQNECSKKFKISPDETLKHLQTLYEKKMVTYPRTDARVLSTAVAKGIKKTIFKLSKIEIGEDLKNATNAILDNNWDKTILKSKYVDDNKITDHYAIVPTGEGSSIINSLKEIERKMYFLILRRFIAIFYPKAQYSKQAITITVGDESFYTTKKVCIERGYLDILESKKEDGTDEFPKDLRKGQKVNINSLEMKEGETSPPKRFTTGSIIIAMENAGKLIEDEELREHIKGAGIGTSATRAEILKKLMNIDYVKSNNKTQTLTPTELGEMIYEVINASIPSLLNPKLTASWEKGLKLVHEKSIQPEEFMVKLESYTKKSTYTVFKDNRIGLLNRKLLEVKSVYSN